jgi:endonuclease YncB( thermonuclease family)
VGAYCVRPVDSTPVDSSTMGCVRVINKLAIAVILLLTFATLASAQVVTKVSSGDVVVIQGIGKVRLLGIRSLDESAFKVGRKSVPPQPPARSGPDPAEQSPPQAASAGINFKPSKPGRTYLQQLVLGKTVRLQYDPYGDENDRSRAYVFLADGTLVNAELLRKGLARVDNARPFAHQEEFQRLEKEAQASGVGIWTTAPK